MDNVGNDGQLCTIRPPRKVRGRVAIGYQAGGRPKIAARTSTRRQEATKRRFAKYVDTVGDVENEGGEAMASRLSLAWVITVRDKRSPRIMA